MPARAQQRRRQLRARVDDVLAVVDHQQHVAVGEVAPQRFGRRGRAAAADAEGAGELGCQVGVCGAGRQIHEPDPVRPSSGSGRGRPRWRRASFRRRRDRSTSRAEYGEASRRSRRARVDRPINDVSGTRHVVLRGTPVLGSSRGGRRHHAADDHIPTAERRESIIDLATSRTCRRVAHRSYACELTRRSPDQR